MRITISNSIVAVTAGAVIIGGPLTLVTQADVGKRPAGSGQRRSA